MASTIHFIIIPKPTRTLAQQHAGTQTVLPNASLTAFPKVSILQKRDNMLNLTLLAESNKTSKTIQNLKTSIHMPM
jgi:hypothetical protein